MKATDLRIGNLFLVERNDGDFYETITANDIVELDADPIDDYYQPIPLTEEWLLKFGAVKNIYDAKRFDLYGYDLYYLEKDFPIFEGASSKFGVKIKYVHELQNLFYGLKKELKIK